MEEQFEAEKRSLTESQKNAIKEVVIKSKGNPDEIKRKYKKNSASHTLSKAVSLLLIATLFVPVQSIADPTVGGVILPPASFTHIEDPGLLRKLGWNIQLEVLGVMTVMQMQY